MGRPSRKRPRETEGESSTRDQPLPLDRHPSYPFGELSNNSGLKSLVKDHTTSDSNGEGRAGAEAGEKTVTTNAVVQGFWGGMAEADIAAASSTLRVGVDVDIDSAGVAWLVNTSHREHEAGVGKTRMAPLSANQGCNQRAPDHTVPTEGTVASVACRGSQPAASRPDGGRGKDEARATAPPSATLFDACEPALRDELSRVKREFDEIPPVVFKRARSACNPAEALGSGSFLNRSAMKLANIDAILGGKLSLPSRPSTEEGTPTKITPPLEGGAVREPSRSGGPPPTLLFADLCGGPGGFSEYLLRRRRRLGLPARGWGISLREGAGGAGVRGDDTDAVEDAAEDDRSKKCGFGQAAGDVVVDPGVPTPTGEDGGSTVAEETPAPRTNSVMPWVASGAENEEREGASRDGRRRSKTHERGDPCAWRLDHLRPWCEVSAPGTALAAPIVATECSQEGHGHEDATCIPTDASSASAAAIASVCNGSSATAATGGDAVAAAPLLEMRIDYGPKGTGDVTDEENLQGFVESILASTGGRRLGLVVADGGFGAARDDPEQERVLSVLLHAEALAALLLLEEGGSFVCKLFECWTESTAALVYLLHRKFRRIAVIKPITSRPASGERYLVCTGFSAPPSTPYFCPLTDSLRAKVKAMQDVRQHHTGPGLSPNRRDPRNVAPQTAHQTTECSGHHGEATSAHGGAGVGGGGCDASVVGKVDVALSVQTEMKHDVRFMSYLRLSNDALASLQAKACWRIVDVASTKRGRAWAFRDSNTRRSSGGAGRYNRVDSNIVHKVGDFVGGVEDGDDAAAARCFRGAWGLDGL